MNKPNESCIWRAFGEYTTECLGVDAWDYTEKYGLTETLEKFDASVIEAFENWSDKEVWDLIKSFAYALDTVYRLGIATGKTQVLDGDKPQ